ncbi:NFAT activation molecule 1 isoform X2 [Bos taurus]|nr:NFAT activation molecule 1 isoform X2 [Bos taurus]
MGPCLWALAGVWNGCPWHFCGHSGAPSRTLAALSPATASGIQGPPPSSSLGPLLLLAACQSKGTPRLAHVAPAHFAGRHTPFAELKAKREAADTRLETEETPAEERSVTHTGLPILVSLANRAVSFSCSITYPYTPKFKDFRVSYFHVDLQGQTSSEKKISCQPGPGSENQTHTTACPIFLKLPNSSATGTYYCSVHWQDSRMIGEGTFILVRDTGYQEPPQSPQKLLLFCFVGILAVLSILATALLLWKKRQIWALWKHAAKRCPGPSATSSPGQPPSESVYTDLQRRETEVYDCIQSEAGSPPTSQGLLSQEKQHKFEGDGEFNLVYENL